MKNLKIVSNILLLIAMVGITSCSNDDSVSEQPTPQGEAHSYSLSFSGGEMDGNTFSNTISKNLALAMRSMMPNDEGGEFDIITISMPDLDEINDFSIGMHLNMNGDQAADFGLNAELGDSFMTITYNDYSFISESGSVVITNLNQFSYQNIIFPYFKLDYTAQMMGTNLESGATFSTQVSGTIIVEKPIFN